MYKVMLRDNIADVAKDILEKTGKIDVTVDNDAATSDPDVLAGLVKEFHGIGIRSKSRVNPAVLKNADNLKVVARAGVGVDNIDIEACAEKNVVVMNTPGGNTVTTAEHALGLMMALARNICRGSATMKEGRWEKKKLIGVQLCDKTLGVVGLGRIGKIVADRANGLGMKVIASDPFVTQEDAKTISVELVEIDELYTRADFITLHVPRAEETKNMINASSLNKMKKGVRIINCSRGEVVNLDDLYEALVDGHVAGAALDVFPVEPPDAMPIMQLDNVILTPHLGASTIDAQIKVAEMLANQMAAYLINGEKINVLN